MKSIDMMIDRRYDSDRYHCVHFVIDAGKCLFGYDFSVNFLGVDQSLSDNGSPTRHTVANAERTHTPTNGTVVLMNRFDNALHVGLYIDERVLHLSENGVRYETIRTLQRSYKRIRYYNAKDFHQSAELR